MKIAKLRLDYILLIYVPFALAGILLSVFCQNAIITLLKIIMPLALLAVLICLITPIGSLKPLANSITANTQKNWFNQYNFAQRGKRPAERPKGRATLLPFGNPIRFVPAASGGELVIKLIGLQSSVLFIFIAFSQAIFQLILSNHTDQTPNSLIHHTLNFYQGGLWPWPFIVLMSCALAYLGRQEKQPALLRKALQPILKQYVAGIIGVGIEIFLKQSVLFSALLTLGILSLVLAHQLAQLMHLSSLLTFSLTNLSGSIIILLLFAQNPFTRYLTRKLWRQRYADKKLILIFCCSIVPTLILLDYLLSICVHYFLPNQNSTLLSPLFNTYKNIDTWYLLSFIWWIGIIPPLARAIALLGSEQSLRRLIAASLLLPLILCLAWHLRSYLSADIVVNINDFMSSWPIIIFISMLGLIMTACLFQNPLFCKITTENQKPNTNSAVSFLRSLWQLCTAILSVYMLANLYILTYLGAALVTPVFATLVCALLSTVFLSKKQ